MPVLIGGVPHEEVSKDDIQPGDYIEFELEGRRCRRVKDVHLGRKRRYIQFEPFEKVRDFKCTKIDPCLVVRVWRKK